LAALKEKSNALKADWQKEKAAIDEQRKVKEEIERFRTELERAQRRGELGNASEISTAAFLNWKRNWPILLRNRPRLKSVCYAKK